MKTLEEAEEFVTQQFWDGSSGSCFHYGRCDIADLLCFIYERFSLDQQHTPVITVDIRSLKYKNLTNRWDYNLRSKMKGGKDDREIQ